jgi:hypothetical protein
MAKKTKPNVIFKSKHWDISQRRICPRRHAPCKASGFPTAFNQGKCLMPLDIKDVRGFGCQLEDSSPSSTHPFKQPEEGSASGIPLSYSTLSQPYFHAFLELRLALYGYGRSFVRSLAAFLSLFSEMIICGLLWSARDLESIPVAFLMFLFGFRVGSDAGTSPGALSSNFTVSDRSWI